MLSNAVLIVNIIVAVVTGVLAIATFMVARATKHAAEATEKTIEAQYKPWVVMYMKPNWQGNIIDLIVKNVGYGPAYDISFELPEYFPYRADGISPDDSKKPENWVGGPLRNGMSYLAPGESWRTFWGQYGGLLNGLDNKPLSIIINFKTAKGIYEKSHCILDVRDLSEHTLDNFEDKTVRALKEIAQHSNKNTRSLQEIARSLQKREEIS